VRIRAREKGFHCVLEGEIDWDKVGGESAKKPTGTRTRGIHLIIRGRVQGVGFRFFSAMTRQTDLALAGYVRTLLSGGST